MLNWKCIFAVIGAKKLCDIKSGDNCSSFIYLVNPSGVCFCSFALYTRINPRVIYSLALQAVSLLSLFG